MATVIVSSFVGKIRTINPPANFSAEPFVCGNLEWPAERIRFAYAFWGANNGITALSPYTEVKLGTDWTGHAIRIPGGDAKNTAVAFMAFWQRPDHPIVGYRSLWFPMIPENGKNHLFHFSVGDLRLGGQRLLADPNLGAHYDYQINGSYFYPRGASGLEEKPVPDPTLAPLISSHGLPVGQYTVSAAYLLPNGSETARTSPQLITLASNQRAILCHRNEPVQQGVTATVIYVQTSTGLFRSVFPRNFVTWYVSRLGTPAKFPQPNPSWMSNALVEALDSDAEVIVLDTDLTVDVGVVVPYKPNINVRRILSENKTVTVNGTGELLTVNAEPHIYLEGLQFAGPTTTQGINFVDHNGGCNFFCHFTRCNIRLGSGYWLCVDDAGGVVPNGSPLYVTGHTVSEVWFDDSYCQQSAYIAGSQSVDFFFSRHRQDVNCDGSLETAAMHLKSNKFVTVNGWWPDNSAHCLLNLHNEAGPISVQVQNLFCDKAIQF